MLRVHLIHALQQVTQKSLKEKLGLIRSLCLFLVLFSLLQEVDQKDLASFFCQKVFCLFSEFYCTGLTSRPLINVKTCHSVVSDSSRPQGLLPTRLLCPWNCSGKTIGVGCHSLLQGIFLTQRLNLSLLHSSALHADFLLLSHRGSPECCIDLSA